MTALATDTALRIDGVSRVFGSGAGQVHALDNIHLDVRPGEFVCLLGASGCGKSTLLSLVTGLDQPTAGTVDTGGRRVGMMFQDSALLPWLTAGGNVEVPLKLRRVPKARRAERVDELLTMVRLAGQANRRPHELSGGMRQRVSLARAFAQEADILCMDEPFGALDAMTRDLLHDELERIWRETGITVLFVTHDVREAVRLGDRIVLLSSRPGRVAEIFDVPIERPRRIDQPQVSELASVVTARLREEVARHGH
ncbi:sulfate ABC transporter ATP-binding protein [Parafrankia colletiae]|uniref:Sulfate ABC transporter ATP-binding protein n=1 Tax=Parafrankia colletiae TaxID=573497 RepID=A0A1S1RFN8_9ACTN|nr:ABC transporter ATP-binding protein [Parafrankia colletiae]MCK9898592.1 ABC transporter ATP-binding protein [Frankia sp. Cpl3]OHV44062.1 sulfate ABC transporter ATP-binding protein [Parafrankia colletiae]